MTQEDKQLLLQDLCTRQPYGVKVQYDNGIYNIDYISALYGEIKLDIPDNYTIGISEIKPYLRSISSMTEEEREDFWKNVLDIDWRELEFDEEPDEVPFPFTENDCGFYLDNLYLADLFAVIDWLNEHYFDYRGLIQKGLAISTEEFNPYKD